MVDDMNKILLVIGASSDMGISLIDNIYSEYDCIIAHYNHMNDGLQRIKKDYGDRINLVQADLSCFEDTKCLIDAILSIGVPNHIVHFSAPHCKNNKFEKIQWEVFQNEIDISLKSLVLILQKFLPLMAKKRSGKVIVMLSYVVNDIAPGYCSNYVVTKYAMLGLVKALSTEYANKGITVNGISPSWVDTKFIMNQPELLVAKQVEESPIGRLLTPQDIVPSIAFLLSEGGNCINGQNITIACGR